jgi:hypothetical protein
MMPLDDLTNFFLNSTAADQTLFGFREIQFLEDKIVGSYDLSEEDLNILRDLPSIVSDLNNSPSYTGGKERLSQIYGIRSDIYNGWKKGNGGPIHPIDVARGSNRVKLTELEEEEDGIAMRLGEEVLATFLVYGIVLTPMW